MADSNRGMPELAIIKSEPLHHCDGVHHKWGYSHPLRCVGCGHAFSDMSDLEVKAAFERRAGSSQ